MPTTALPIYKLNDAQNKWEHVTERQLDIVLDHLHTLNDLTPKIKCDGREGVDPELIFGLDSKLFQLEERERHESHPHSHSHESHTDEVQTLSILRRRSPLEDLPTKEQIENDILKTLSKETVYRLKGFALLAPLASTPPSPSLTPKPSLEILNWAFGRWDWTSYQPKDSEGEDFALKLTIMGERGPQLRNAAKRVAKALGAEVVAGHA